MDDSLNIIGIISVVVNVFLTIINIRATVAAKNKEVKKAALNSYYLKVLSEVEKLETFINQLHLRESFSPPKDFHFCEIGYPHLNTVIPRIKSFLKTYNELSPIHEFPNVDFKISALIKYYSCVDNFYATRTQTDIAQIKKKYPVPNTKKLIKSINSCSKKYL